MKSHQPISKMKMFSQVIVPDSKKNMEYVVTGEVNQLIPNDEIKEGPYYFIQCVIKGAGKKINKANFKQGKFYHYSEVILM